MPSPLREAGKTTTASAAMTVVPNANIAPCKPRSTKIVCNDVVKLNNPIITKNNADEINKIMRLSNPSIKRPAKGRHRMVPIWKYVIARPASKAEPPNSAVKMMGNAATKTYWVI